MDVIWETPPAAALSASERSNSIVAWLLLVREHPGEWARLDREYKSIETARAAASYIRGGAGKKHFEKGEFEAVTYDHTVWVRYVKGVKVKVPRRPDADDHGDDGSADEDERKAFPGRVRAWAKLKGIEVSEKGRLPDNLIAQYEEDTGESRPANALTAVE